MNAGWGRSGDAGALDIRESSEIGRVRRYLKGCQKREAGAMTDGTLTIGVPNFGAWIGDDWCRLLDVARACEDAGADRLTVTDHVVMGRNTDAYVWGRFPTAPDGPWLEPLTVLAAMSGVTRQLRLATG